jgi:hypothetical protein
MLYYEVNILYVNTNAKYKALEIVVFFRTYELPSILMQSNNSNSEQQISLLKILIVFKYLG